jgi:hypothetical protein
MSSPPAFAPGGNQPSARAGSRPRIVGDTPFRRTGRPDDQTVVGLDDVDDPVEAGLDVERESLVLDHAIGGLGLIRDRELDPAGGARESQLRIGIEASRGLSRARQDAHRPVGELDHPLMVQTPRLGNRALAPAKDARATLRATGASDSGWGSARCRAGGACPVGSS